MFTTKRKIAIAVFMVCIFLHHKYTAAAFDGWLSRQDGTVLTHLSYYCTVDVRNFIRTDMQYAEASTNAAPSSPNVALSCSVSATYYTYNTVTQQKGSTGNGNGANHSIGTSKSTSGNVIIYKIYSSHQVTFGDAFFSYPLTTVVPGYEGY